MSQDHAAEIVVELRSARYAMLDALPSERDECELALCDVAGRAADALTTAHKEGWREGRLAALEEALKVVIETINFDSYGPAFFLSKLIDKARVPESTSV
jgi:hypothetical protein